MLHRQVAGQSCSFPSGPSYTKRKSRLPHALSSFSLFHGHVTAMGHGTAGVSGQDSRARCAELQLLTIPIEFSWHFHEFVFLQVA